MNSKEIKYLTFEGGGGKCIAYLGAIKALEEKNSAFISCQHSQLQNG